MLVCDCVEHGCRCDGDERWRAVAEAECGLAAVDSTGEAVTPLGRGDTTAFYSLAWFPTPIAFVCTYCYVLHLWQRNFEPNVSPDDLPRR